MVLLLSHPVTSLYYKLMTVLTLLLLLLTVLCQTATACHPVSKWACDDPCEGAWQCDDPVCPLLCEARCDYKCICFNSLTNSSYGKKCEVHCPEDQCESDSCPSCEIRCPMPCVDGYVALCEAPNCTWRCIPNVNCPKPRCEQVNLDSAAPCRVPECQLQSERPACEYSTASALVTFWINAVVLL